MCGIIWKTGIRIFLFYFPGKYPGLFYVKDAFLGIKKFSVIFTSGSFIF